MPMFPSEEGLPRSQDGSEPILQNSSVGSNRILLMLKNRARIDQTPRWTMFLLNGFSIYRNNYDKAKSLAQIYQDFSQDCETFITYLEAYLTFHREPNQTVPVVVYLPNYKHIPKEIRRDYDPNNHFNLMYTKLVRELPPFVTQTSRSAYTERYIVPCGDQQLPHQDLAKWIQSYALEAKNTQYRWGDRIFLMTHCPIDLHLVKRIKPLELVESYTAEMKTPDQFGTKLDIKMLDKLDPEQAKSGKLIPFNHVTHRAFGDPIHIAPLAQRNTKKELLLKAIEKRWDTRTLESITADVVDVCDNVTRSDLNKYPF